MNLADYRKEFTAFQHDLNAELAKGWRRANPHEPLPAPVFDRYSDLFSQSGLDFLHTEQNRAESYFEVDRRAVQTLQTFAEGWFLETAARSVTTELVRAESRSQVAWDGKKLPLSEVSAKLPLLPRKDRHALQGLWQEAVSPLLDLWAEREEHCDSAAQTLGYANHAGLWRAAATRLGIPETCPAQAETVLRETETCFTDGLYRWAKERQLPFSGLERSDAVVWEHPTEFDAMFRRDRLQRVYEETLRGVGVRLWNQPNLEQRDVAIPHSFVARLAVPQQIRFFAYKSNGWYGFAEFFRAAALAQQAAWTSRNLPVELRYEGDRAVPLAFAELFGGLLNDTVWAGQLLDIPTSIRVRPLALRAKLWRVRWAAAQYLVAQKRLSPTGCSFADSAQELSRLMALRVTPVEAQLSFGTWMETETRLRAWFFEAQLRDYLKTKFGNWWNSRKAGDFLIDLWNLGLRYTADEMAAQIGLGSLSPEALTEEVRIED